MTAISVIVPCFNERATVEKVVKRVALSVRNPQSEIIVVDDGSTDDGCERLVEDQLVHVIRHGSNRGKGAAVVSALQTACGEVVVIHDADEEYSPEVLPLLCAPILSGEADVVYGTRFPVRSGGSPWHRLGNGIFSKLTASFTGWRISDVACGHKAFRRNTLGAIHLREAGFAFDVEVTFRLAEVVGPNRVLELHVPYSRRGRLDGKKLGIRAVLRAAFVLARWVLKRGGIRRRSAV